MKKLLFVLGAIMLFTGGTALAETTPEATDLDAAALYQTARDKVNRLSNYEMLVDVAIHMQTAGRNAVAQKTINLKMNNQNREGMQYLVTENNVVSGQQRTSTTFYTEGTLYQDANGQKVAQQADLTDAMRRSEYSWQRMLPEPELLRDIYVSNVDENGNVELTYACENGVSNEQLSIGGQTLNEYYGKVVISPDGMLIKGSITVDVDMLTAGNVINTYTDIVIIYSNIGIEPTFEWPSVEGYTIQN